MLVILAEKFITFFFDHLLLDRRSWLHLTTFLPEYVSLLQPPHHPSEYLAFLLFLLSIYRLFRMFMVFRHFWLCIIFGSFSDQFNQLFIRV